MKEGQKGTDTQFHSPPLRQGLGFKFYSRGALFTSVSLFLIYTGLELVLTNVEMYSTRMVMEALILNK